MKKLLLFLVFAVIGISAFSQPYRYVLNSRTGKFDVVQDSVLHYSSTTNYYTQVEVDSIMAAWDTISFGDGYVTDRYSQRYDTIPIVDLDSVLITIDSVNWYLVIDRVRYADTSDYAFVTDSVLHTYTYDSVGVADTALHAFYADTAGYALDGNWNQDISDSIANFWNQGNVIYVPLNGTIQTYIDSADAGSTLILASGVYTITDTIKIDKQLNIVGQGGSGFVTAPVTPSHGTLITSSTANMAAFYIESDNVRISNLSINLTGAASTAVVTENNLQGEVFSDLDIIVNSTGLCRGLYVFGSDAILRNITFSITSSDAAATGVYIYNNSATTRDAIVDAFIVTGSVSGGAGYSYALACWNNTQPTYTLTLNLYQSVCKSTDGTSTGVGVASYSQGGSSNSIVNAYMCTIDGADYDVYQNNSNELNLGGSVLVNNKIFGDATYRAVMVSGIVEGDTVKANEELYVRDTAIIDLIEAHCLINNDSVVIDSILNVTKTLYVGGDLYVPSGAIYVGDSATSIDLDGVGVDEYIYKHADTLASDVGVGRDANGIKLATNKRLSWTSNHYMTSDGSNLTIEGGGATLQLLGTSKAMTIGGATTNAYMIEEVGSSTNPVIGSYSVYNGGSGLGFTYDANAASNMTHSIINSHEEMRWEYDTTRVKSSYFDIEGDVNFGGNVYGLSSFSDEIHDSVDYAIRTSPVAGGIAFYNGDKLGYDAGFLFTGSTKTSKAFYTGASYPTNTNALNFDGTLIPTKISLPAYEFDYGYHYGMYIYTNTGSGGTTFPMIVFKRPLVGDSLTIDASTGLQATKNGLTATYSGDYISIMDGTNYLLKMHPFGASNMAYSFNTYNYIEDDFHTLFINNDADTLLSIDSLKTKIYGYTITDSLYTLKSGTWSDIVFEENYKLPTLTEKEQFIKENKHLPSLKSAAELDEIAEKNNGYISNVEYNSRLEGLVKEVEELTLLLIEQQKLIELLKNKQ